MISNLFIALLSGGFALGGCWLTNRSNTTRFKTQLEHEERRERKKILVDKGEMLYQALFSWKCSIDGSISNYVLHLTSAVDANTAQSLISKGFNSVDHSRLSTLLSIYYPDKSELFAEITKESLRAFYLFASSIEKEDSQKVKVALELMEIKEELNIKTTNFLNSLSNSINEMI